MEITVPAGLNPFQIRAFLNREGVYVKPEATTS